MTPAQEAAYVAFVEAVRPRLLRHAWLLTGDASRAEDIVQEALIKVYLHWTRIAQGAETSYARRAVTTTHIDGYRKTARETLSAVTPERGRPDAEPEDTAYLMRVLDRLSERERTIVVLRHYVGETEAQVADTLGISVGTVKSTASRALTRLRTFAHEEGASHA